MKCEELGCTKRAKYALFKVIGLTKTWVHVCDEHDKEIAIVNRQWDYRLAKEVSKV